MENALNALHPGSALLFDLALDESARSSMSALEATWDGVDLAGLKVAFLRGFSYCDPVIPSGDLDLDWGLWRFEYIALQQKYTYLYSLFSELQRRGVKLVNPPEAHLRLFMRPFVLERVRQAGLPVPALVCTNRMDVAREFCGRYPAVVWRPAAGRAAFQCFKDRQRDALLSLQKPPVLLAEGIDGLALRAYLYDGQPLLCLKRTVPDCSGEETLEMFGEYDCGEAAGDLRRLAELLQAPWLQVSFALKDGKAWIYDVDADPLIEDLPAVYGERLTALLAARLSGAAAPAMSAGAPAELRQRPTIFLRRMLRVLFEFEYSKYKE